MHMCVVTSLSLLLFPFFLSPNFHKSEKEEILMITPDLDQTGTQYCQELKTWTELKGYSQDYNCLLCISSLSNANNKLTLIENILGI